MPLRYAGAIRCSRKPDNDPARSSCAGVPSWQAPAAEARTRDGRVQRAGVAVLPIYGVDREQGRFADSGWGI
ncbi:MAG: hypothetical protein ABSE74_00955 [Methanoregula sp.]